MLDVFGRMLTDHTADEAGIVAVLRFLTDLVPQLSSESVLASFWIGIAGEDSRRANHEPSGTPLTLSLPVSVSQISQVHFLVGLDLIAASLRTLVSREVHLTSSEFVEALVPEGNFFLSNVDSDWGVNLEGSFAFSILSLLYKGVQ